MYDGDIQTLGATPGITDLFASVLRRVEHSEARSGLVRGGVR